MKVFDLMAAFQVSETECMSVSKRKLTCREVLPTGREGLFKANLALPPP